MTTQSENEHQENDQYLGNIWGWKISFISLAVILFLIIVMGVRYCSLSQEERQQQTEEIQLIG